MGTQTLNPETGTPYSRADLKWAFELVENKKNWKMPISTRVELTAKEVDMVKHAVVFFAGCQPTFRPVAGKPCMFLVTAPGYYKAVGA